MESGRLSATLAVVIRLSLLALASCLLISCVRPGSPFSESFEPWLQNQLRTQNAGNPEKSQFRYDYAFVDLDGDGTVEALVYQAGPGCGTGGCGIEVYKRGDISWYRIARTSIGWAPVYVFNTTSNGWRDLGLLVRGGGELRGYIARLRYDGNSYPYNPSMLPAERTTDETVIVIKDASRSLF